MGKNKEKEIRSIGTIQLRSDDPTTVDSRIVEGYAVVFDTDSVDMGFIEQIQKGAITDETIKRSDVFATLNHDATRGILARSLYGNGTLKLELDEKGLKYSFEAPHTALGDETLEMIRRGDITGSSFAFTVEEDEWFSEGDNYRRFVKTIDYLYDISPVFQPAYQASSATTRKFEDFKATLEKLSQLEGDFSEKIE